MAKSGLTHIDVGSELTKTEFESEETHALINGTAFPGSPVERQLFYRNDLHEWYIYNGSAWVSLQGAGGGMQVHDNTYHDPDYEEEGVAATQIETHRTTAVHTQDQPPASHGNAAHSPDFAEDADLDAHIADEAAPIHGSASAATPNKLIHRDAAGRAKVVAPAASDDIAQKAQADAVQTDLDTHGALATAHSAVSAATASRMVVRDAAARAKFAAPAASGDALIKGTAITDTEHGSRASGLHADSHAKQHAITSTPDHTSSATPGRILKADANGLPQDATNTDTDVADAVTKKHAQNTDTDLSPAHKDVTTGAHGAGGNTLWHGGLTNIVDKDHLSQDFGSSTLRLHAWNFTPKQGKAFQVNNGATSPFDGLINSAGSGGLTATNVPYDGETNENCLKTILTGATRWGRFILHNTTRSNTRLIVDFDETTNVITTESSTDDWADNDVITLQSQTCTQAGYMDLDLSDEISANEVIAYIQYEALDKSAGAQSGRRVMIHPFSAYDQGKRLMCPAALAGEFTVVTALLPIVSQKMCVFFDDFTDAAIAVSVLATLEYADT